MLNSQKKPDANNSGAQTAASYPSGSACPHDQRLSHLDHHRDRVRARRRAVDPLVLLLIVCLPWPCRLV